MADRVYCSECGEEYDRLFWGKCPYCNGMINEDSVVLQPVHLGKGIEGAERRRALELIASEGGYSWGGQPSIGRWLVAIADEKRASQISEQEQAE